MSVMVDPPPVRRAGWFSRHLASGQPSGSVHGQYAGFASRGLGLVIDLILVTVITLGTIWVIDATMSMVRIDTNSCAVFVPLTDLHSLVENLCRAVHWSEYVFSLALTPLYLFLFWWLAGETVGMGIAGVRVVSVTGGRLTARMALLRLIGYAISILALGLGFLWSLADDRRQGWHDKLAGTFVIYWRLPRRLVHDGIPQPAVAPDNSQAVAQDEGQIPVAGTPVSPTADLPTAIPKSRFEY